MTINELKDLVNNIDPAKGELPIFAISDIGDLNAPLEVISAIQISINSYNNIPGLYIITE